MANEYVNIKTPNLDKNVPTKETFETVFPSPNEKILAVSDWDANTKLATITVEGVLADEDKQLITVVPKFENREDYINAGIYCYRQAENQLSFKCEVIPTSDLYIYVILENVVYTSPTPPTPTIKIYGAEWTNNTESPVWTRTDDAVGFADPQPAVAGGTGSSPFDNIMPWSGMVRHTDDTAGEMVAIPKFYYKITREYGGKPNATIKIQISDQQFDGSHVSPAHMDRGDGKGERNIVYVGRYHCHREPASYYKSVTNVLPTASQPYVTMIADHSKSKGIYCFDYATLVTIQMLYLVEFANWNSQAMIGYGGTEDGTISQTGSTDTMQYHTGTMQASRTTYGTGIQYRYIEDLWANLITVIGNTYITLGDTNDKNKLFISLNLNNYNTSDNGFATNATLVTNDLRNTNELNTIIALDQSTVDNFDWVLYGSLGTLLDYDADNLIPVYTCDKNIIYNSSNSTSTKQIVVTGGSDAVGGQKYGLFYFQNATIDNIDSYNYYGCRNVLLP